jgi:hypothetical protein
MQAIQRAELIDIPGRPRSGEFFQHLSPEALSQVEMLEQTSIYPPNTLLFLEKELSADLSGILRHIATP